MMQISLDSHYSVMHLRVFCPLAVDISSILADENDTIACIRNAVELEIRFHNERNDFFANEMQALLNWKRLYNTEEFQNGLHVIYLKAYHN